MTQSELAKRLTEIERMIAQDVVRRETMEGQIQRVRKELWGNGSDGMRTQIAGLLQAVRVMTWLGGAVFIAILGQMATRAFSTGPSDIAAQIEKLDRDRERDIEALRKEIRAIKEGRRP